MRLWQQTTEGRVAEHLEEVARRIRREADLVHLCARGARIPTIRNLIGKVSDNKIKEINRRFHGDRKGAKTRGNDYFTETSDRRRDSSVIVSLFYRLHQAGLPVVSMYVQLHNMYMRERVASPAFDIDELIRLTCAVEMGTIKGERCPKCGALVVMQCNELHPEKRCFMCHPNPISKTRVRVSTAIPIDFPSSEQIEEVILELISPIKTATELVMYGARPQEVDLFVPGQETYARKMWPLLLGMPAPQGSLPFTSLYYVEKIERRRHAAYIIKMFCRLKRAGMQGAHLFLALYKNYLGVFGGAPETMHFSRIRGIVHFHIQNELKLVACPDCTASYVILADELPGEQTCPNCRLFAETRKVEPAIRVEQVKPVAALNLPPLPGDLKRRRQQKSPVKIPDLEPRIR